MENSIEDLENVVNNGIAEDSQDATEYAKSLGNNFAAKIQYDSAEIALNYQMGNKIIDILGEELKRDDLTPEERKDLHDQIQEIKKDTEKHSAEKDQNHFKMFYVSACAVAMIIGAGVLCSKGIPLALPAKS